jgi:hypothetical protein
MTVAADVAIEVLKGRRRVARATDDGEAGRNSVALRGLRATGSYTVVLSAQSADGQTATDRVPLTVRRR